LFVRDGFEVLKALQAEEATKEIPVIFLTADHERDSLVRAFSAGAVDYVTKPFVPEELLSRVRAHTGLKMARDHMQQLAEERQESLELIAHDLRNHFTNVIFSAEMLASRSQDESAAKLVESIRGAADTGLLFLQAVLDQAAGEARGEAVEPQDNVTFVSWSGLAAVMTDKRHEILRHLRRHPAPGRLPPVPPR